MEKLLNKTHSNSDYSNWIKDLKQRYLSQRLKAAVAVNGALIEFYWNLGKDISEKSFTNIYGSGFFKRLSLDLQAELPDVKGLSPINIRYAHRFFELYKPNVKKVPQAVELLEDCQQLADNSTDKNAKHNIPQPVELLENYPQLANDLNIFQIPWGHHRYIIDKCKSNSRKALFFVQKTLQNNWSRNVLLNFLDTDLYEREGKAVTNFKATLPTLQSDLAQQITKDTYCFDFLTIRKNHDEKELEDAIVKNVTRFLLELGTGFSFMGKQFRIEVGSKEFFMDMLFYNTRLHAYVVIELKTTDFMPEQLGQLGFYISAVNHQLKTDGDNPTIGLLICKNKDNVVARYALDTVNQPLGISEYQLAKLYPANFKSSLPTIEDLEHELEKSLNDNE